MDAQTYETTVRFRHPHKWMVKYYSFVTHEELVFAMDTPRECQLPLHHKYKLASHILNVSLGMVIKDSDALFVQSGQHMIPPPIRPTLSTSGVTDWSMMCDDRPVTKIDKCECGAHSVGSNRHSSYCAIKGDI